MHIQRFPFRAVGSNMYVLTQGDAAVVIDPWPCEAALPVLDRARTHLVILTHEHIDHFSGLDLMERRYGARVLWQALCTRRLERASNCSPALLAAIGIQRPGAREQIERLHIPRRAYAPDLVFDEETVLHWGELELWCVHTPGHSPGGACILADGKHLFTGDSLIPGVPVLTRLRGGSRARYDAVTLPFLRGLDPALPVYPGHGTSGMPLGTALAAVKTADDRQYREKENKFSKIQ